MQTAKQINDAQTGALELSGDTRHPSTIPHSHMPELSVAGMLQKVVESGITTENVAAMDKLVGLYERMEVRKAEQSFTTAFVALQADLPTIVAKTVIQNRGKYEKFEDVMHVVQPLLHKHGFTVSFSMDFNENRIIETCTLKHVGGHSQSNSFAVRVSKADSDTQSDVKAATTAKRNALCNALNIVIRQDVLTEEHDPRIEGGTITSEQAFELERRVAETNSDKAKFLRLAGTDSFATIKTGKYDILDQMLRTKERGGK